MTDRKVPSDANLDLLFSERLSFQRRGLFDRADRRYRKIIEMQPDFTRGVVGSWYTPVQKHCRGFGFWWTGNRRWSRQ